MTPLAMLTTNLKVSTAKEIVMLTLTNQNNICNMKKSIMMDLKL